MSDDRQRIQVVCANCGNQLEHEIGRLKARAGRNDFICANCGATVHYTAEELELIIRPNLSGKGFKLSSKETRIQ